MLFEAVTTRFLSENIIQENSSGMCTKRPATKGKRTITFSFSVLFCH